MTQRLLSLWDEQQSAYVAHRENRFTAVLDVLSLGSDDPHVLDLACGPGALTQRVLAALPRATVTAVDYDPVLLGVARGALLPYGDRVRIVEADLISAGWPSLIGPGPVDAVVSSTALHWLSPDQLLAVYQDAAALLRPGGVLMNADHLRFDNRSPTLLDLSNRHDERTQRNGFAAGALDYTAWYDEAGRDPSLAALLPEREKRFADRPPQPLAPLDFHLAALRTAGFAETGTIWQYLDDYVVFARR
ncbi:class I SAM-dependent methyltransferase [Paractinoplanes maris]|uniref:class I SAM-dependent methyltransferase n=1 Tax=Paractinoplanes maris TaxID=1734446 RepID=UPI0020219505|nr:class I SAM-dependent methyltransferase [Actinoplanes maris]